MKTLLTLTAALIGGVALPSLLMAGTTEATTGCATVAVDGSNYTVFADPTCPAAAKDGGDGEAFLQAIGFAFGKLDKAVSAGAEEEEAE